MTRAVIDLPGPNAVQYVLEVLRQPCHMWTNDVAAQIERPRPLIVLDLDDHDAVALARMLTEDGYEDIADQIEAQTKPARIPEPGLWGVVEASTTEHKRCVFIRDTGGDGASWITPYFFPHDSTRRAVGWADLIDPTLIREGVTP